MSDFKAKQDSFVSEYLRQTGSIRFKFFAEVLQNFVDKLSNSIADIISMKPLILPKIVMETKDTAHAF